MADTSLPEKWATIYALVDPRETEEIKRVRYIGMTTVGVHIRLRGHITEAKSRWGKSHRASWIKSLLKAGVNPHIEEICQVPFDQIREEEIRQIAEFRRQGYNLVNSTDGGDGVINPPPDVRIKMGIASRGNTFRKGKKMPPEIVARIANKRRGRRFKWKNPMSLAHRAKISAASLGRKHTEEAKKKIAAASAVRFLGIPKSLETRAKISTTLTGRRGVRGEEAPWSRLNWSLVREIRKRWASEKISQRRLAQDYNICQQMVGLIINGKRWIEETPEI